MEVEKNKIESIIHEKLCYNWKTKGSTSSNTLTYINIKNYLSNTENNAFTEC